MLPNLPERISFSPFSFPLIPREHLPLGTSPHLLKIHPPPAFSTEMPPPWVSVSQSQAGYSSPTAAARAQGVTAGPAASGLPPPAFASAIYSTDSPGEQKLWSDVKIRSSLTLPMTRSWLPSTHVTSGTRRQSDRREAQGLRLLSATAELQAAPDPLCAASAGLGPVPGDSPGDR